MNLPFHLTLAYATHEKAHRTALHHRDFALNQSVAHQVDSAHWSFRLSPLKSQNQYALDAQLEAGEASQVAFGLSFRDDAWSTDNYVLVPGAAYNGNRFHACQYDYSPPVVGPDPRQADRKPWTGDIPRLNLAAGLSHLDLQSIDAATPALTIFFPHRQKALCLFTAQLNPLGTFGYEVIENPDRSSAEILLMAPGMRHDRAYSIQGYINASDDRAASFRVGQSVRLIFALHWVECSSVPMLFDYVFRHRSQYVPVPPLRNEISFSAAWEVLHEKHNTTNWREELDLYQVSINDDPPHPFLLFQSGWIGGMITPYAMLQDGDARSQDRALRNLDSFLAGAQSEYGLFHEFFYDNHWFSKITMSYDDRGQVTYTYDTKEQWTLVRRTGDVLYFIMRSFLLLEERNQGHRIKQHWRTALKKNALAVIDIWQRNGELGQYVDVQTGDLKVAGSTAGALMPAALLLAADYFEEPGWICVAEAIAEKYRREDLAEGVTTGGPGDCVQAPDSETACALVESFMLLFERTGKKKWLQATSDAVKQVASWVISYDYTFPAGSALAQIKAQTRGCFLANAQNKHGTPGICTLSGQGIFRLFRATGDSSYLELMQEIAHTIPQYMGREDKAIPTRLPWGRKGVHTLPPGWISERVNIAPWGEALGELAAYSCWCEVAMMLTWCDIPGIYWQPDKELLWVSDHVEAQIVTRGTEKVLRIENKTTYAARVRLMVESSAEVMQPKPVNFAAALPLIAIPPLGSIDYALPTISTS